MGLGNRALCFLQINRPGDAFQDAATSLRMVPDGSPVWCKFAYRKALAAEKLELEGEAKQACLVELYKAANCLQDTDQKQEAEMAFSLYFSWSRKLSRGAIKALAKSSGFELDEGEKDNDNNKSCPKRRR